MDTATDVAGLIDQLGMVLIPVLVPLIIGFFKKYLWANVPGPLLPVAAALLGPLFDLALVHIAGAQGMGLIGSALLGLAGVGVREVKEGVLRAAGAPKGSKVQSAWPATLAAGALALLFLTGCAQDPELRWAQGQKAYNATMKTLADYRAPCVDTAVYPTAGPDHPLCRIGDDDYVKIEAVRARVDSLLVQIRASLDRGDAPGAEFYLEQLDAAILELASLRAAAAQETAP